MTKNSGSGTDRPSSSSGFNMQMVNERHNTIHTSLEQSDTHSNWTMEITVMEISRKEGRNVDLSLRNHDITGTILHIQNRAGVKEKPRRGCKICDAIAVEPAISGETQHEMKAKKFNRIIKMRMT